MNKDKIFQLGDDIEISLTDGKENEIFKFNSKDHDKKMENKKLNEAEKTLMKIINNTWDEAIAEIRDKNKKTEFKNNEMNRIRIDSMAKGLDKEKIAVDNREDLNRYDIVKIIDGEYKGLSNKECKFLDYVKTIDKVLIQTDEFNRLYVNPEDVELVRKAITQYDIKYSKNLSDIASIVIIDDIIVKNRGGEKLNLLVQTEDKIKIYCNDKINIMSYYHIVNNLNQKAKENIKIIKFWEE
ncbi:TPA: hypothetical protein ACXDAY_002219 [Clostridium botulinum]|uniref:hypothetical protein n=1 Tax=Clostridium botulinum TaxID=1491 RepID=UPI000464745C|nr:hypothetical protein [Clostridium botulinum]APR02541.1 hypothetical protein RSJ2_3966 [Clostridium botulinum]AUN01487.1 hypothetical protein RSJ19_00450 [Clostridium botulinum]MBN3359216.1 hypothetical protein [Clostridium botulinum]QDY27064.1 hypothetical protein CGQ40_20380 [Clostridium botulinum]